MSAARPGDEAVRVWAGQPVLGQLWGDFHSRVHFMPHFTPGVIYLFNRTSGETEAQRGQVTSLYHLVRGDQAGLDARSPDPKPPLHVCVCVRTCPCVCVVRSLSECGM